MSLTTIAVSALIVYKLNSLLFAIKNYVLIFCSYFIGDSNTIFSVEDFSVTPLPPQIGRDVTLTANINSGACNCVYWYNKIAI